MPFPHSGWQGALGRRAHPKPAVHDDTHRCCQRLCILSAKDGKDAFLNALHDKDLVITGDFVPVMWFQGLTDSLAPNASQQTIFVTTIEHRPR